jgi:acyl-CoA thioester hydrolase
MAREMVSSVFTHCVRVRYYECDPQGVVWNANFLNYLDVAHTELTRHVFGSYSELAEAGVEVVMAETRLRFLSPAHFDDELDVDLDLTRLGTTAMTMRAIVRRAGAVLVEGEARYVYVESGSGEKTPIPQDVRSAFEPYVSNGESTASR